MNRERQIDRIKLHMLISLARSQRALAHIIESCANGASEPDGLKLRLSDHIAHLEEYQRVLTRKITGTFPKGPRISSPPGKVWLNIPDIRVSPTER